METVAPSAGVQTFLIADVRGYTSFTVERGDVEAARLTEKFATLAHEVVASRDGAVIELRGDEALAVFSSARGALWAALDLQARFAEESRADPSLPLQVGIGVDTGEAIPVVGGYRGAAVNLAARLCSLAGPGEVLTSETVVSIARRLDGVTYRDRGMVDLKGFADPVRVLEVITESRPVEDARLAGNRSDAVSEPAQELAIGGFLGSLPANPMVGRRQELEQMVEMVDAVAQGAGRVVLLAGEPGAGKTRLAQELTLHLRNRGVLIAAGSCFESRQTVPYYPFLDVLAALWGSAPPAIRSQVGQRWPYVGRLLPEAGIAGPLPSEGQDDQERLFRAITAFTQAIAEEISVAILLDDLHWADEASLDLLQHLARHTRGDRVLILGTYRDVEVGRQHPLERALHDLRRQGLTERIVVRRLDQMETSALVASAFGEEVSDEFAALIFQRTDGNPFFTQEVLRGLIERGDVYRANGHWERREMEEIEVPESVRAVIGQRLSRLHEATQDLLREASVLGPRFRFDDVQAMGRHPETTVEAALKQAQEAGIVRETGPDVYIFNHALTQQALYAELSTRQKRRLHLAMGAALEGLPERERTGRVAEVAWHFLEGDDTERAIRYSVLAGDQAEAVFAHDEAERHYRTAAQLAGEVGDRAAEALARENLSAVLNRRGQYQDATETAERAVHLYRELDDLEGEGRATAFVALHQDTVGAGLAMLKPIRERLEERGPSRSLLHVYRALVSLTEGYDEALSVAERCVEMARAVGDEQMLIRAEHDRGNALQFLGRLQDSVQVHEQAARRAEAIGDVEYTLHNTNNLAHLFLLRGEFSKALQHIQRTIELADRIDDPRVTSFQIVHRGFIAFWAGDWERTRGDAEQGLGLCRELGIASVLPYALMLAGVLAVAEGRWQAASAHLPEAAQASELLGDPQPLQIGECMRAEMDILSGRSETARDRLQPLLEHFGPHGKDIAFVLPKLAWAYADLGDVDRAAGLLAVAIRTMDENGDRLNLVEALRVQGIVQMAGLEPDRAEVTLGKALSLTTNMPCPYGEARILFQMGLLALQTGDNDQAQERLGAALVIFQRLGARKEAERTEQALVPLGQEWDVSEKPVRPFRVHRIEVPQLGLIARHRSALSPGRYSIGDENMTAPAVRHFEGFQRGAAHWIALPVAGVGDDKCSRCRGLD